MRQMELPPPAPLPDVVGRMKEALRRAILTLIAIPDPDRKFRKLAGPQWIAVRDSADAYGWTPARVKFVPTPRDVQVFLDVLGWLAWYERERDDADTVRIFSALSTGAQYWQLSNRFSISERTLRRRVDNMACVILYHHEAAFQKLFLDGCHECQSKDDPALYSDHLVPETTQPTKTPSHWSADGIKPSGDETIPEVAEARSDLVERLQRQNRKRQKAERREKSRRHQR